MGGMRARSAGSEDTPFLTFPRKGEGMKKKVQQEWEAISLSNLLPLVGED